MATPKEIDREQTDRLYELLWIKANNGGQKNKALNSAISRAKASMSKETIAWVEKQLAEQDDE